MVLRRRHSFFFTCFPTQREVMQNRVVEIKVTSEITNTTKLKYELESVA